MINSKEASQNSTEEAQAAEESLPEEKTQMQEMQEKYDELNDRHLRLLAEYDNFRKRSLKEKDDIYQNAVADTLTKFLAVKDNFDRAAEYEPGGEEFAKGVELIEKGFRDVLASFGVEPVGEHGQPFNPDLHHAVMHIEDENLGENVISQVLQKGYKIGGRVLRYAMVQTAN
jgi:molecular chaperone GrpE